MNFSSHPLWLVGFRPFFALACLAGAVLPLIWVAIFSGAVSPAPTFPVPPLQWHAHEMFYGFGWAVLGGFLLTATKNWVSIRGYHGPTLMLLAAAWLLDRFGMAFGGGLPVPLLWLTGAAFQVSIVLLLMTTLIRHAPSDSYRDNIYFLLTLPLFVPAKFLVLSPEHFANGWSMSLGLFRIAFLLMLERTLTPFMKGAFQVTLPRYAVLDHAIKCLALALVFQHLLPTGLADGAMLLLGVLLLARWFLWRPDLALRRLDIGIMYLGYLAIAAQLLVAFFARHDGCAWIGSVTVHIFTTGAMGLIVPAMVIRIAKGHTGRKVVFDALDKTALWLMLVGFLLRVVAPQLLSSAYALWAWAAATCWLLAFGLLAWRYVPWLLAPRVDGKEH